MQLIKQIGSILLLLVYSLGMAHGAIPHSHYVGMTNSFVLEHGVEHNGHHHHYHNANYTENHTHVAHGAHFDNGLVDLLICLLSESEYEDIADLFFGGASVNGVSMDLAKIQLAAVFAPFFTFEVAEVEIIAAHGRSEADILYCYSHTDSSSRRGPPTVS